MNLVGSSMVICLDMQATQKHDLDHKVKGIMYELFFFFFQSW